jgi:hypothetical protein
MDTQPAAGRTTRLPRNIALDGKTVSAMVHLFCQHQHGYPREELCADCSRLMSYAYLRLAKCPFGSEKTTCNQCPIHCYRPSEREAMKVVMRFAGPRMLLRHPALSLRHLWMERRGAPPWPPRARPTRTDIPAVPPPA